MGYSKSTTEQFAHNWYRKILCQNNNKCLKQKKHLNKFKMNLINLILPSGCLECLSLESTAIHPTKKMNCTLDI